MSQVNISQLLGINLQQIFVSVMDTKSPTIGTFTINPTGAKHRKWGNDPYNPPTLAYAKAGAAPGIAVGVKLAAGFALALPWPLKTGLVTSARGLKTWLFTVRAGFGTLGCVLTAFNPDAWPPSKPPRQGTAAAGCRLWHNGLCFNGFQSGRLAALKPSLAGYGCIRQPLPLLGASTGGVRLPLALLGASKLGFSPFPAGSGTMGCVLTAFNPDVWPPSNPPRQGTAATACRLWHNGLFFTGFQSGRIGRPQTLPGRALLHPSATASAKGLRKLDFTLFRQALAQWAVF